MSCIDQLTKFFKPQFQIKQNTLIMSYKNNCHCTPSIHCPINVCSVLFETKHKNEHTLSPSCLYRASTVSKHFFLFQTDAHNYKIIGILKQLKFRLSLQHVSVHLHHVQHTCTTGWYAAMTLITSVTTST